MRIPLIEFENLIDPAILKRGKSYFRAGRVEQCEETDPGIYYAVVAGTEDYAVQLLVADGIVSVYECDCPYDSGPVCKHAVAVMFHLTQDESKTNEPVAGTDRPRQKAKQKTIADRLNELLDKVSHEELKEFIREQAKYDRALRELFLTSFAHIADGESKAFYMSQVKAILRSAAGRSGFIDWRAAGYVGVEVSRLLDAARKHIEARNHLTAIKICTAVMEQMVEAFQYADDSNGDIGGTIGHAVELLYEIASTDPNADVRGNLLEYCLAAFDKRIYGDWDWHFDMIGLASALIRTEKEAQPILERLEKVARSDFERETAEVMTYEILKKVKGETEAEDYLERHISNPRLRRAAIAKSIGDKQFDRARSLAAEGIRQHREKFPGLVREWNEWILKTAEAEGNTDEVIKYARQLFIHGFRHQDDYYSLMRKHIGPNRWAEFVEALIRDMTLKRGERDPQLADLFIKENMWPRLLEFVKRSPDFHTFDAYEKYLKKDYASELAEMYAEAVIKYLDQVYNPGRNDYQTACRYIRRMKKLGSPQKAESVVTTLREKYPRRKALLEELEMV